MNGMALNMEMRLSELIIKTFIQNEYHLTWELMEERIKNLIFLGDDGDTPHDVKLVIYAFARVIYDFVLECDREYPHNPDQWRTIMKEARLGHLN